MSFCILKWVMISFLSHNPWAIAVVKEGLLPVPDRFSRRYFPEEVFPEVRPGRGLPGVTSRLRSFCILKCVMISYDQFSIS